MSLTGSKYDHRAVEKKWQKKWEKEKLYHPTISESQSAEKKYYNLWMFPYPSAEGVHVGTIFSSTGSDVFGRFMRMQGKSVFQPMGYDSFGIHSENFALKIGEPPAKFTARAIKNYERQFKEIGHGYDWARAVTTSDPDYYKWTQWLFIQMFKAGLAYKKKALVNFCPGCKTVLSDEQIVTPAQAGKTPPGYEKIEDVPEGTRVCERCGSIPQRKELSQWFFKITNYADRLLKNLDIINWSERVKVAQREWIGKKEGAKVKFNLKVKNQPDKHFVDVFTTRVDTLFGVTFIVIAPELAKKWLDIGWSAPEDVTDYVETSLRKTDQQRKKDAENKTGIETGIMAVHPVTNELIPVWVADYVLMDVGTGAVMGVPAHDKRDFEFASKFSLPITRVIDSEEEVYEGEGKVINSDFLDGMISSEARVKMLEFLAEKDLGKKETIYHLRDWLISRQRYWGPPIPMIECEKCGWQPVAEEDLPVLLPEIDDYQPKGEGRGPLAAHPEFYETTCPNCGGKATRETDVSDTFLDSAWYFLRYPSVDAESSTQKPFDTVVTKNWLPVDLYFGGAEHSVLHLMYARFVTMALYDMKLVSFEEPFPNFFAHGLMIKDGAKMSKSKGNVVNPDEYVEKYGADTLRLYLMFMGPMDGYPDFRDTGIEGMARFTNKIWNLFLSADEKDAMPAEVSRKLNQTIKRVTEDINVYHYNTAIAAIMEYVNVLTKVGYKGKEALGPLAQLLAPFTPHLAEEVWSEVFGNDNSIHSSRWPVYDDSKTINDSLKIAVQVNGKLRATLELPADDTQTQSLVEKQALADNNVKKWVEAGKYKAIFIPGRLINFVTK